MYRKRVFIVLGVLLSMFLFCGCSIKDFLINEDKLSKREGNELVKALDNKDEKALKELLAKEALDKAGNIDEGIKYLFNEYQGKSTSVQRVSWSSGHSYTQEGSSKYIHAYFEVQTSEGEYFIWMDYWPVNTINPDKKGIYALGLVPLSEKDTNTYYDEIQMGIYYPEEYQ